MASYDIPFPLPLSFLRSRPLLALGLPTDHLDVTGAPLMEGLSQRFQRGQGDLVRCPYADHRRGIDRPMNLRALSAYRVSRCDSETLLLDVWDAVAADAVYDCSEWSALWGMSLAIRTLPLYMCLKAVLQGDDPDPTPDVVASLFKIFRGVHQLLTSAAGRLRSMPEASGAAIYRDLDESKSLVGPREVCAAPPQVIIVFFDALLDAVRRGKSAGDVDPSHRCAVEFGAIYDLWEHAAFLFEACRCARWNAVSSDEAQMMSATKCRHTFRHAAVAREVGLGMRQLDRTYYEQTRPSLGWFGGQNAFYRETYYAMREVCFVFLDSANKGDSYGWDHLIERLLLLARRLSTTLGEMFDLPVSTLRRRDLEIFFGPL